MDHYWMADLKLPWTAWFAKRACGCSRTTNFWQSTCKSASAIAPNLFGSKLDINSAGASAFLRKQSQIILGITRNISTSHFSHMEANAGDNLCATWIRETQSERASSLLSLKLPTFVHIYQTCNKSTILAQVKINTLQASANLRKISLHAS